MFFVAAKEVVKKIKLQIQAGKATPAPPVGTVLGPAGINLQEFCTKYNDATKDKMGDVLPVEISIYDDRSFDFVVKTKKQTYLIEVNFYSKGGGSKPSEVARAYSELSPKINGIGGYKFVWITDGKGWDGVGSFKEAYKEIPYVYNLTNIQDFVLLLRSEL